MRNAMSEKFGTIGGGIIPLPPDLSNGNPHGTMPRFITGSPINRASMIPPIRTVRPAHDPRARRPTVVGIRRGDEIMLSAPHLPTFATLVLAQRRRPVRSHRRQARPKIVLGWQGWDGRAATTDGRLRWCLHFREEAQATEAFWREMEQGPIRLLRTDAR